MKYLLTLIALTAPALAGGGFSFDVLPAASTDFLATFQHPGIDTQGGLAPVRGVTCCVRYRLDRELAVENEGPLPATVDALFASGRLRILLGGAVLHDISFADSRPGFSLEPFDGLTDGLGASGETATIPAQDGFISVTIEDPAILATLSDAGPLEIRVEGTDALAVIGPGSLFADGESLMRVSAFLVVQQ